MRDGSDLGARVTDLLLRYLASAPDRAEPVVRFAAPAELEAAFRASGADLPLGPAQSPLSDDALLAAVETTLRYSVRTQHPRFFNQNFAGADPVAVLGDWVAAAAHTTGATYEMAPVFTLMERALIARLAEVAGLQPAEGLLNPGGALSNLYALHLARCCAAPASLTQGLHQGPRLLAFASAHAHYSLDKSVALAGLGREALHRVPCDEAGRLRPEALAAALLRAKRRGELPFFVCATAGTTVVGAFDPLPEIAALCAEHDVWLHVDGCHGASVLFSPRHRHLLRGIESADSLAWDLHKMLGLTQQCAVLLVRAPGQLRAAFASQAGYLFQPDKNHAELDLGDLTFQCARRIDSFKLWLTWKARGDEGFAHRVDHAMALAAHAVALLAVGLDDDLAPAVRAAADPLAFRVSMRFPG